jgi:HEXXH motif-containing protein
MAYIQPNNQLSKALHCSLQKIAKHTFYPLHSEPEGTNIYPDIITSNTSSWIKKAINEQNAAILQSCGPSACIDLLNNETIGRHQRAMVIRAINIVRMIWPEMGQIISQLVSHIALVARAEFWSSSIPGYFGLIFISPKSDWTIAHYIESLVHEASHLDLSLRQTIDAFVTNGTQICHSPLLPDPRSVNGLLHATFVLSRTCEALKRVLYSNELLEDEYYDCRKLWRRFSDVFHDSLRELEKVGEFTPLGRRLLINLRYGD